MSTSTPPSTPIRLSAANLEQVPESVARPTYDRSAVTPGIAHIGVGGFHRAHQAWYLDRLMTDGKAMDFGLVGIGVLPQDSRMRDALESQDHLYTLVLKHPDGSLESRVIGSIVEYVFVPDDPEAAVARLADPAIRILSLTVTEGGYHVNQVTEEFDPHDPGLEHDIAEPERPQTAFGLVTAALRRRRADGTPPFTVQSCDNLPGNGDIARRTITAFARLQDAASGDDLAAWMDEHVAFPNSMVDRITPVTAPSDLELVGTRVGIDDAWPVVAEPFTQWVIQDAFPGGRPPWEDVGAQIVDDVVPYELMKLRLLNSSHQALCYLGYLAGHRYAHEVLADDVFPRFLLDYMEREGTPTLPEVPGVDLDDYRRTLIERFGNPEVRDTLARLCAESSDRIPKWLLPVVRANLASGGEIERSALVVAAWSRYAEGTDEDGEPIDVVDRLKDRVMAAAARQDEDPLAFLRDPELFGDLVDDEVFTDAFLRHRASLRGRGARATVAAVNAGGDGPDAGSEHPVRPETGDSRRSS